MSLILPIAALTCLWSCTKVEELSKEAEITAFTFDKAVEANSVVTTTPVINSDGTITFSVSSDATGEQLSALVPTVTVSENATVTPASGTAVDFSNGPVTFTVTAQDGVTTSTYEAEAIIEEPDEPEEPEVTFPIDEITGTYKGLMDITLMDSPVGTDLPRNIMLSECSDTSINLSLEDFSFQGIAIGDIVVENCALSMAENGYSFSGEQKLTLVLGEMNVSVSGTVSDGDIVIDIQIPDFKVTVNFEGTRLTGNESGEAEITSFTFDTANPANSIVTSVPVVEDSTITFNVRYNATAEEMSALVPTVTVSENAVLIPESGSAVDFSSGSAVFTVIAENGTVNEYVATVTTDEPSYPIDEEIAGTYKGLMDISFMGSPVGTDLPRNIVISECSDTSINLSIKDFSFQGMTIGDIEVENCVLSETEDGYAFTGEQNLTLILGEMNVSVSGTVTDGNIVIDIQIPDFTVTVHFEGARLNGDESGEAEITSFTFDTANPANAAVYTTDIDSENSAVNVTVYNGAQDLTSLVPAISISAGATISPATDATIDLSGNKTVTYTVVAENGTVKEWTVSVTNTAIFHDFEEWTSEGAMYDDILNPVGWATCNDAVALIKNMGFIGGITYDGEYPVRPTENGYEGQGAVIESVYTTGGNILGQKIPAVTAGTIFLGSFNAMAAMSDPMATTSFGTLFEDKPVSVRGYLKYTAGTEFYDENGELIPDKQDLGTVNVVLYEVSNEDETLNGSNIYTSDKICATGTYETAGLQDFTQFSIDINYIKDYDPNKMYKLAVIFAASKEGAQYRAAKNSIMVVDNVAIICE